MQGDSIIHIKRELFHYEKIICFFEGLYQEHYFLSVFQYVMYIPIFLFLGHHRLSRIGK
jgi:hypothetical protein